MDAFPIPISLMTPVLAIYGYHEGKLYLGEAIFLVVFWVVLLAVVWLLRESWWYFIAPTCATTIYSIIRVLGADAKAWPNS